MAIVLQLENFAASTTINLANATGIKFLSSSYERDMSYTVTGEDVVRVYRFIATSTTKALARANLNAFVALLRKAIRWGEDDLLAESIFLREQADGETAARMLVKGFKVTGVTPIAGLSPLQQLQKEIVFDVAFTVQNHREEPAKTAMFEAEESDAYAIGKKMLLFNTAHTAPSRLFGELKTSELTTFTRMWIGLMPFVGSYFQHIWEFDFGAPGTDTTETTSAGSYGTNIHSVSFATTAGMATRSILVLSLIYDAASAGAYYAHARGEYYALLRYKITGSGTVTARLGQAYAVLTTPQVAYNEPRLLVTSGNWRFAPMGIVKFPPRGNRQEVNSIWGFGNLALYIQAQKLSGSPTLILDSITLIPYHSFLHVDNMQIAGDIVTKFVTHENLKTEAISMTTIPAVVYQYANIAEERNWLMPVPASGYVQVVYAAEQAASQVYDDNLDNNAFSIYEAYEGYNG